MIVTIADAVFAANADPLALLAVLHLGEQGRHRVQTEPVFDVRGQQAVNAWLDAQSPELSERVIFALEDGIRADSDAACDVQMRIEVIEQPRFDGDVPQLPLADALRLMQRPLGILVEDGRNDGTFLRRVITGRWRQAFDRALHNGWMAFENGGGLENMRHRVEQTRHDLRERLRLWVLFDSDAREPGIPSSASEALRMLCVECDVAHHQLERRSMENYLPPPTLLRSANHRQGLSGRARTRRRKSAQAFQRMPAPQRHCYNMKAGFRGDRGKDGTGTIPGHFGAHATSPDLQNGFGRTIGELFADATLCRDVWFMNDGQTTETGAIVQALLRRL